MKRKGFSLSRTWAECKSALRKKLESLPQKKQRMILYLMLSAYLLCLAYVIASWFVEPHTTMTEPPKAGWLHAPADTTGTDNNIITHE